MNSAEGDAAQLFRVDRTALPAVASEMKSIAEEASLAVANLQDVIVRSGACWGDDPPGRSFAEFYLPDAEQGVQALQSTAATLHEVSARITEADTVFESQDRNNALHLDRNAEDDQRSELSGGGYSEPGPGAGPETAAAFMSDSEVSGSEVHDPLVRQGHSEQASSAPGPRPEAPERQVAEPSARFSFETVGGPGSAANSSKEPSVEHARDLAIARDGPQRLSHRPPAVTANGVVEAVRLQENSSAAGLVSGERKSAGTPGGRGPAVTPWSARAETSRMPADGEPSRGAAPRLPTPRAGAAKLPAAWAERSTRTAAGLPRPPRISSGPGPMDGPLRPSPHPGVETGPAAMRVANEMAARHGLQIIGFGQAGLDEATVREIAASVDHILGKYRAIDLRVIQVADLPGLRPTRMIWEPIGDAERPGACAARIILDRAVVTNANLLVQSVRAAAGGRRSAPGSDDRPVYSTLIRELGRVLDAAGGFRAHRLAERTLIAEYLRISGASHRRDSLAKVVHGYKWWRDQLSGCAPGTRFDPCAVLAEAFTEAELCEDRASEPTMALYRLLVATAGTVTGPLAVR